jgi:hypothetical protein
MTEEKIAEINKLAKTKTVDEISKLLNIGRTTIKKYKNKVSPKKVYQCDLNGNLLKVWDDTTTISNTTTYNKSTIKNACNGHAGRAKNIAYGYMWRYE